MGIAIFCLIFGFTVGYLWRDSRPEKRQKEAPKKKARNVYLSYNERQRAKIRHQSDAERIRELNLLSTNESKFMRLLQHQFTEYKLIIKDRRFYIADQMCVSLLIPNAKRGTMQLVH